MGKKFFRTLLFALLFVLTMSASAWAETAVVTGNDVNLREGPGTGFRIITSLAKGARVTVTDRSDSSWYYVKADNAAGFMAAAYLEIEEDASAQPVENAAQGMLGNGKPGYVDAMYVRMRSAPGSDYSVLGEYNRGKPLLYYGNFGDWAACIIDGQPGFIYAEYIRLGSFDGWNTAVGGEEEQDGSAPYIQFTPTPDPEPTYDAGYSPSDELSLVHALTPGVDQIPGYVNANYVRFRKGPGSNYPIIETYNVGKLVGVTGIYQEWTACWIDNRLGFIYSDYITVPSVQQQEPVYIQDEETTEQSYASIPMPETQFPGIEGYVAGSNVRMRWAPSMSAPIVEELSYGNAVTVVGKTGDWAAVICNGKPGYIYGSFLKQGTFGLTAGGDSGTYTGGNYSGSSSLQGSSAEKGYQISQYALQFVGCPYSWGGRDPSGFDCSGFVYYVYQQFGITLNRVAQDQASNGRHVDASELQAGDILCFYSGSSYIGHVGIYLGYGMFVHAQNSATGVVITELAGHYSDRGFEARRIV